MYSKNNALAVCAHFLHFSNSHMQFHRSLMGAFALALPLLTVYARPLIAGRQDAATQFPLLSNADCTTTASFRTGTYDPATKHEDGEVSIARQFYDYFFWIRAEEDHNTAFVCNIDTDAFDTLTLQLGVGDGHVRYNASMTVNIYQSGTIVSTHGPVQAGDLLEDTVDLLDTSWARPGNIAIELLCDRTEYTHGCYLVFIEAELTASSNYISGGRSGPGPRSAPQDTTSDERSTDDDNNGGLSGTVGGVLENVIEDALRGIFD